MSVWRLIAEDMKAWKRIGFLGPELTASRLRRREAMTLIWRYPGVRATIVYRLSYAAQCHHVPLVPMFLCRYNLRNFGLDVVPFVPIGPGLYIPHPVGTVISARGIGRNCHIISSVTIGMRTRPEFPLIGNDVTIGAGARVLGAITIGDGAQIGANAVVLTDVPSGTTAVGIPARVIRHDVPASLGAHPTPGESIDEDHIPEALPTRW